MTDWTYAGIRIFTQDMTTDDGQTIARLNPIDGGTVLHIFGNDELITRIQAFVVGLSDITTLRSLTTSGVSFPLTSPFSGPVNYYLNKINTKLQKTVCQTLRPDLPEDSPVYLVDMELYYDG